MFFKALTVLLSFAGVVTPLPHAKRADSDEVKLYAYGTGISGLQVYGAPNGKAYIATSPSSNLTELTWASPSIDSTWNVSIANDNSTDNPAKFYIITSDDAAEPCGFQRANETAPTGASMMGFTNFTATAVSTAKDPMCPGNGSQIMWLSGNSYQSKFWAESTDTEGLYLLTWNVNNANMEERVPVTIKTIAPATV